MSFCEMSEDYQSIFLSSTVTSNQWTSTLDWRALELHFLEWLSCNTIRMRCDLTNVLVAKCHHIFTTEFQNIV